MILDCIEKSLRGSQLSGDEASSCLEEIISGLASETQTLTLFLAMSMNGANDEALAAMAKTLRRYFDIDRVSARFEADVIVSDVGGAMTRSNESRQIETIAIASAQRFDSLLAASFVMAGAGIKVLHLLPASDIAGRPSRSLLNLLGVRTQDTLLSERKSASECGLDFLDFPSLDKPAERIEFARRHLPIPTILDLLTPIACSSRNTSTLLEVEQLADPKIVGHALIASGVEQAAFFGWGLAGRNTNESLPSIFHQINRGILEKCNIGVESIGFAPPASADIVVSSPAESAMRLKSVLAGEQSPYRNAVLIYAAAGIVSRAKASNMREAIRLASESIDSGRAKDVMTRIGH